MKRARILFIRASQVFHIIVTFLLGVLAVWFTVGLLDIVMFYVNDVFYRDIAIYKKIPVLLMLVSFPTVFTYKMARFVLNIPSEVKSYIKSNREESNFRVKKEK